MKHDARRETQRKIAEADRRQLAALVEFNEWRNAAPSRCDNPYAPEYKP